MSADNQFAPGTALDPTASVEISISCRELLDLDVFSRSDPMVVVYKPVGTTSDWVELIRTEVLWDCLNPDFATKVTIDYHFEEEQALRFEVYDIDNPSASLDQHDFIGYAECTLGQIVASGYTGLSLQLIQKKTRYNPNKVPKQLKQSNGKIVLVAEELVQFKEEASLCIRLTGGGGSWSRSPCCLCPLSVFYTISKIVEGIGSYTLVYRSEAVEGESPWNPAVISIRSLCNGDKERGLQFQFFQTGFQGYHTSLGFVNTTVNKLKSLEGQVVPLLSKAGKEKAASMEILTLEIAPIYTFFEYIGGGTQIHCCFAIDYTASNGDPTENTSLHHISPVADKTNPYEQAILAVGEIMQDYDPSKLFPVYGFGARIPPNGEVSHNFPVTLNQSQSPYCRGIDGVLEAYRNCIKQVQLYGPTNFALIVKNVASLAKQSLDGQHYWVLLIITDGIITDMQETAEAIVEASRLPLSIIIVGVGSANFQQMDILDGDIVRLSANGVFAERDIVQFVPYRDHQTWMTSICPEIAGKWSTSYDGTRRLAKIKLAQEVLAEIPDQLTGFMKSRSIVPKKRANATTTSNNNTAATTPCSIEPTTSSLQPQSSSSKNTAATVAAKVIPSCSKSQQGLPS